MYHVGIDGHVGRYLALQKIPPIPSVSQFSLQSTAVALLSLKNQSISLNTAGERWSQNESPAVVSLVWVKMSLFVAEGWTR